MKKRIELDAIMKKRTKGIVAIVMSLIMIVGVVQFPVCSSIHAANENAVLMSDSAEKKEDEEDSNTLLDLASSTAEELLSGATESVINKTCSYITEACPQMGSVFSFFGIYEEEGPSTQDIMDELDVVEEQLDVLSADIAAMQTDMDEQFQQLNSELKNQDYQACLTKFRDIYAQYKTPWKVYQDTVQDMADTNLEEIQQVTESDQTTDQVANETLDANTSSVTSSSTSSEAITDESSKVSTDLDANTSSAISSTSSKAVAQEPNSKVLSGPKKVEVDKSTSFLNVMNKTISQLPGANIDEKIVNLNTSMAMVEEYLCGQSDGLSGNTLMGTGIEVLKDEYPCEHQIRDDADMMLQYGVNLYIELYTLKTETITYKYISEHTQDGYGDDVVIPGDLLADDSEAFLEGIVTMSNNSGVEELETTDANRPDPSVYYEGEEVPPNFETVIYLQDGTSYEAYNIIDNETGESYMIVEDSNITLSQLYETQKKETTYNPYDNATNTTTNTYKTDLMNELLAGTADGKYCIPKDINDMASLQNISGGNLIKFLTYSESDGGLNLSGVDPSQELVFLGDAAETMKYDDGATMFNSKKYTYYYTDELIISRNMSNNITYKTNKSDDTYDFGGSTGEQKIKDTELMLVFKERPEQREDYYTPSDSSTIANSAIVLSDGQTLDLSRIGSEELNLNIYVNGTASIIGNPDANYSNVYIELDEGANLTTTDLNITGYNRKDAVKAASDNTSLNLSGNNSFTAIVTDATQCEDADVNYDGKSDPNILAGDWNESNSQMSGLNVDANNVVVTGANGTFNGANGGAGIYVKEGTSLNVNNATIEANGSSGYHSTYIDGTYGAGIGGISVTNHIFFGIDNDMFHGSPFDEDIFKDIKVDTAKTHTGTINISDSNIKAQSGCSQYGSTIGAQGYNSNGSTDGTILEGCSISNSIIDSVNNYIDPRTVSDEKTEVCYPFLSIDLSLGDVDITDENGTTKISQNGKTTYAQKTDTLDIVQSGEGTTASRLIIDECQNLNLNFDNVSMEGDKVPLKITGKSSVTMNCTGANSFVSTSGKKSAGINVESDSTLTITGDGTLQAVSKGYGAGIGSMGDNDTGEQNDAPDCGTINIKGNVTVDATSKYGAGIGGGAAKSGCNNYGGNGGNVNISENAKVTATGGELSPGIGGGGAESTSFSAYGGKGSNLRVYDNAVVKATSTGSKAVGIGGGSAKVPMVNVAKPGDSGSMECYGNSVVNTTKYGGGKVAGGRDWESDKPSKTDYVVHDSAIVNIDSNLV